MNSKNSQPEAVRNYITKVCEHVGAKDVHPDIELEMSSHLDERIADMRSQGVQEEEAVSQAIALMGDASQIGRQLHAAHKPVMEWSLAAIVAILAGIGLIGMYAVQLAYSGEEIYEVLLFNKSFYTVIGILLLSIICFTNYQKLRRYSWHLYCATVMIMLLVSQYGISVNGSKRWFAFSSFSIDVYAFSPYLFLIAIAGLLTSGDAKSQGLLKNLIYLCKMVLLYALVPMLLYVRGSDFHDFAIYNVGLILLLVFAARAYKVALACIAAIAAAGISIVLISHQLRSFISYRYFSDSFYTMDDPGGTDYLRVSILEAIRSAGMWGQGFGTPNHTLPYLQSDSIFTYLIYSLGWVFGLGMVALAILLISKVTSVASKLKDPYAKALTIGLFSVIGFQFVWSIFMSVGLLPMLSIGMPFISYGGTNGIIELMAMGMILSVYRRRNMVSRLHQKAQL
ncbi:cell division protein FtsW (lipid II flippase) [Paenibacillus endophyticus]|uniref:Cell division protein FtsW (Lipid II flippase) n=1 Tax=Paenibacillus endophyticus TaxID=1294268 RepID=A0A7W5CE64_9BACL|nr:FtsW/RodA/SpoVE family cell cycle protein [Paenibacillus endophyticus]MBB3156013.1 cell division protein FtsW (lipid II flippase) [Paenibacillus endophyticus]